jgi:hypothetical protein
MVKMVPQVAKEVGYIDSIQIPLARKSLAPRAQGEHPFNLKSIWSNRMGTEDCFVSSFVTAPTPMTISTQYLTVQP